MTRRSLPGLVSAGEPPPELSRVTSGITTTWGSVTLTGAQENDLALIILSYDRVSGGSYGTVARPSGYTFLANFTQSDGGAMNARCYVYAKYLADSETSFNPGAEPNNTHNHRIAHIVYRNADVIQYSGGSTVDANDNWLTGDWGVVLSWYGVNQGNVSDPGSSGYTEVQQQNGSSSSTSIGIYEQENVPEADLAISTGTNFRNAVAIDIRARSTSGFTFTESANQSDRTVDSALMGVQLPHPSTPSFTYTLPSSYSIISTSTANAALTVAANVDGITLNLYGKVMGKGGEGAYHDSAGGADGQNGGNAIEVNCDCTINGDSNTKIGGGGGGGGGGHDTNADKVTTGGGGAGGGDGGNTSNGASTAGSKGTDGTSGISGTGHTSAVGQGGDQGGSGAIHNYTA